MRPLELTTPLPASAEEAWGVFIDTAAWPTWGRLVVSAEGDFAAGAVWTMALRGTAGRPARTLRPTFVAWEPGRSLTFETRVGAAWVARMQHRFDVVPDGPGRSRLTQRFDISGLLVGPLWPWLGRGMRQFDELGQDLARRLALTPR